MHNYCDNHLLWKFDYLFINYLSLKLNLKQKEFNKQKHMKLWQSMHWSTMPWWSHALHSVSLFQGTKGTAWERDGFSPQYSFRSGSTLLPARARIIAMINNSMHTHTHANRCKTSSRIIDLKLVRQSLMHVLLLPHCLSYFAWHTATLEAKVEYVSELLESTKVGHNRC